MDLSAAISGIDLSSIVGDDGSIDVGSALTSVLGNVANQLNMGPTAGSVANPATQSAITVGAPPSTGLSMPVILLGGALLFFLVA